MRNVSACSPDSTFTRTVRSTLATSSTWNVSFETPSNIGAVVTPASFTLAAGASQVLTIVVTPGPYGPPLGAPNAPGSGYIVLTEAAAQSPAQHITVAVRGPRDGIFQDGFETGFVPSTTVDVAFDDITTWTPLAGPCPHAARDGQHDVVPAMTSSSRRRPGLRLRTWRELQQHDGQQHDQHMADFADHHVQWRLCFLVLHAQHRRGHDLP